MRRSAGPALREVEVVEDAYVLCRDGAIASVGAMRDLPGSTATPRSSTGEGCRQSPGSSTATRTRLRRRPGERVRAARGRSDLRGAARRRRGILSTTRATRAAGAAALEAIVARHRGGCARTGRRRSRARVGLRARPRDRAGAAPCGAVPRAASRPGSARTPCRPSIADADAYVDFAARGGPARGRARSRRRRTSSSSGGRSTSTQARRYLDACRGGGARAAPARRPVHRDRARSRSRSSSARAPSTTSRRRAEPASRGSPRATWSACCCRSSALFLGRPMPPARALVDAGAAIALATDFNPGSAFCESLPLVCTLACTQMRLAPEEALVRRAP